MENSTAAASLLAATLLVCATCPGTTWYVSPEGTGDGLSPSSRGEAITTAQKMKAGDTPSFAVGTYNLDVNKVPAGKGAYFRMPDNIGNPRVRYDGVDMGALECCLSLSAAILVR